MPFLTPSYRFWPRINGFYSFKSEKLHPLIQGEGSSKTQWWKHSILLEGQGEKLHKIMNWKVVCHSYKWNMLYNSFGRL
jgi:hypothetical protein